MQKYMVNALVWNSLGEYYSICHRDEQAIEAYENALKIDPINKEALEMLMMLSKTTGDVQRSKKYKMYFSELYDN